MGEANQSNNQTKTIGNAINSDILNEISNSNSSLIKMLKEHDEIVDERRKLTGI